MTCNRCGKRMGENLTRCPRCGAQVVAATGVYQSSTVLISAGGSERVYRSISDVPANLRTRLLKSTNGANSATILIADRRGRKEIAKAMRSLPGPAQRRLARSMLGSVELRRGLDWLTPFRKKVILAIVGAMSLVLTVLAFL